MNPFEGLNVLVNAIEKGFSKGAFSLEDSRFIHMAIDSISQNLTAMAADSSKNVSDDNKTTGANRKRGRIPKSSANTVESLADNS